MIAVEAQGLTKIYSGRAVVDNVSFSVPRGVKCGFLGVNGAGKTTTIKMLTGLKRPTTGKYSIMGKPQSFGVRNLSVGYLPDVPSFYGYMTATEFLNLCADLSGVMAKNRGEQIKNLLNQVGLGKARTRISTYSRGMKQRLGIAQSLINSPDIVFMDEPVSALDPTGRREVMDIVAGLKDTTVVFSTHILADVEEVCDYILIIDGGKILVQETMASLKSRFAKDAVHLTMLEETHAEQLYKSISQVENLQTVWNGGNRMDLISDKMTAGDISRKVTSTLVGLELPMHSFTVHTPSLEEIFHQTIGKGGGAND